MNENIRICLYVSFHKRMHNMKIRFFLISLFLGVLIAPNISAQEADKVLGYWLTQEGDSQVKIFKAKNGKYYGNIKWLEEPNEADGTPKLDKHNENEKLKKRPIMDLQLLKGFKYDADDEEWVDGTIYDPKNGKTYKFVRTERRSLPNEVFLYALEDFWSKTKDILVK